MAEHDHVHIRDVDDSDVEEFYEQQLDPEATQMAAFPSRDREPFFAHWAKIRADPTVVTQTIVADGQVAGNIVCWEDSGRFPIGYWIGQRYWGGGIATKALAAFLTHVTKRPLDAYVATHNLASIRVLEKCGFHRVEDAAPHAVPDDHVEEAVLTLEA